ncbi:MAG: DUF4199 domain-containing protein [Gemmatimonadaceae bacterium]|nr:DUF4199 domain-containing protein [Gemmatimonadaceae bacterium]
MKKTVWTYGLIAGGIFAVLMLTTAVFQDRIGFEAGEILGFTTMIAAFLMVFFGIRSYRDQVLDGTIAFGRAFKVGLLITLIACVCYVATWEVVYYNFMPDFAEKYAAQVVDKAKASGKSDAEIAEQTRKMETFKEQYKNPLVNISYTFVEVFPVGLVVVLVSAGILSRRKRVLTGRVVA